MMAFSKRYKTYNNWLSSSKDGNSTYAKRIRRYHAFYPHASLAELRGHAKKQPDSAKEGLPIHMIPYPVLYPKEKYLRDKSLEVLSEVRRTKKSLYQVATANRISLETVLANTKAFKKNKRGRWVAKKYDTISRVMKINENGKESSIEVANSRVASLIGRYHSAIGQYLNSGSIRVLIPFKNERIKDVQGKYHILETDPERLREIAERIEEPEFYEVYGP